MAPSDEALVKFFGLLHTLRQKKGLPSVATVTLPPEGVTANALAKTFELPLDKIEAVICNHKTHPMDHQILPGDRVAFIPHGTPGPHRFTLGIYSAGKAPDSG